MKTLAIWCLKIIAGLVAVLLVAHAVLLLLSGLALRNAYEELREAGRPMTSGEVIPGAVPAAENAAPLYKSAFALLESESSGDDKLSAALGLAASEYLRDPDSPEKQAALETLLAHKTTARALELVEQAAARPRCNFDLPYDQGAAMLVPHVHGFLLQARLLGAKALLAARRGDGGAWRDVETGLRMADALRNEPHLLSALVRMAAFKIHTANLRAICDLIPPDEEAAMRIEDLLATVDDATPLVRTLDAERLLTGEWTFRHFDSLGSFVYMPYSDDFSLPERLLINMPKYRPARQADHAYYLRALGQAAEVASKSLWLSPGISDPLDSAPWYAVISRCMLPATPKTIVQQARLQAEVRIARIGLALKRQKKESGSYPPALAGIEPRFLAEIPPDPFTGQPLVYRPEGDGFVLYSLGENLADDGGAEETKDNRDSKVFDIVWRAAN